MTSEIHIGSAEQLRRLQTVTDAALSHLGVEDLLSELLERSRDLLTADIAAVLLLDPSGTELVVTAARGLEEEVRQGVRVPVGQGFAGTVAAHGEPLAVEHLDPDTVISPILRAKRIVSMLGVPIINAGQLIGVLQIGTRTPRRFTSDDIDLLRLVAERAGMAVQARLSRLDRAAAVALQRSLLPTRLHPITGLDLAARYVPGAEVGVGGDWYDVFALPTGHIGIAIGDVAGSGLHAAVVMGRIRSALRAYALETSDPAEVLTRLDRKVQLFEPDAMATVVYAVLEPLSATLSVSSAGHLPPIVLHPDSPPVQLAVRADLPVGAFPNATRHVTVADFPPGSALFLYTDGLVERRHRPLQHGIDLLLASLSNASADTMCATAMAALLHEHTATDDVAVLAIRRTDPPA